MKDTDDERWSADCRWSIQFPGVLFFVVGLLFFVGPFGNDQQRTPDGNLLVSVALAGSVVCVYSAMMIVLGHWIKRGSVRAAVLLAVITWPLFVGTLFDFVLSMVGSADGVSGACAELVFSGYIVLTAHYAIHRFRKKARVGLRSPQQAQSAS